MPYKLFTTLRFKIALFIIVLLLVTATIFSLITVRTMNRHILDEVIKRAESLCKSTAAMAPYSILSGDLLGTDNIVAKVKETNSDVEYMAVTNMERKILAHTDIAKRGETFVPSPHETIKANEDGTRVYEVRRPTVKLLEFVAPILFDNKNIGQVISGMNKSVLRPTVKLLEFVAPILFDNKNIGQVIIGMNKSVLYHAQAETRRKIMAGFGITMFLGIGCIIVLSSLITRPIQELARGVNELEQGRQSSLRINSHDELGNLTASFNQMTERITSQQARLGTYATELEDAYVSTVKVLSAAIDARDPFTLGHSTRVARLSLKIGAVIGLSHTELEDLEIASLFHDVGKLKTPDHVLLKDGPLDPQEHREIANHSENGAAILSRAPSLQKYIAAVRHHHEWFNGEGYPDGLRGDDIPLHAAIIAVADAFDAMTSSRPYKNARSPQEALTELAACAGSQFNALLVDVLHQIVEPQLITTGQFSTKDKSCASLDR